MNHPQKVEVTAKEMTVSRNVSTVLDIISQLTHCISGGGFSEAARPELDGGTRAAMDSTIIRACNRLDEILGSPTNWENRARDRMFAAVTKTHRLQHAFLVAQREAAQSISRPSFQLKPTIVNTGTEFLAIFGDVNSPGQHLVGRGQTPEAALHDFDEAFKRQPHEQLSIAPAPVSKKTKLK